MLRRTAARNGRAAAGSSPSPPGAPRTASAASISPASPRPSRITWEIEQVEDSCRLTVTHDQLRQDAHGELYGGWPMILSGLKTLLETGELLTTPGSLRYAEPAA